MTDVTAIAHRFETCADPECGEVLCVHYRVGLAAGRDFIRGASGIARLAEARGAGDDAQET
jgi:hypothetical protein